MKYWIVKNDKVDKVLNKLNDFEGASFPLNVTDEVLKTFSIFPIKWEALMDFEYFGENIEYQIFNTYILEKKEKMEIPLEEYKITKWNVLKNKCKEDILKEYSEATQRNIIMKKDDEVENFNTMKTFIAEKRDNYSSQLEIINWLTDCMTVLEYVNTQLETIS